MGKSVAEHFSNGKVAEGIKTLEENDKLFFKKTNSDECTAIPTNTSQILYFSKGDRVVFSIR